MDMVTSMTQGSALKPAMGRRPLDPVWKGLLLALFLIVLFASVSFAADETA